jgi:ABC-type Fe3+-siderophore transport system permease subunit
VDRLVIVMNEARTGKQTGEATVFRVIAALTLAIVGLVLQVVFGESIISWETLAIIVGMSIFGVIVSSLYLRKHGGPPWDK